MPRRISLRHGKMGRVAMGLQIEMIGVILVAVSGKAGMQWLGALGWLIISAGVLIVVTSD